MDHVLFANNRSANHKYINSKVISLTFSDFSQYPVSLKESATGFGFGFRNLQLTPQLQLL